MFLGTPERFNRFYTDPGWQPLQTVYVSPTGNGNGATEQTPASVTAGLAQVAPGTWVEFLPGAYSGCFQLAEEDSGTYEQPVVLHGRRNADGSLGAVIQCCGTGRQTCFNLEAANHVAVDGFELVGGRYGVRAVGADYPADQHQVGVSVTHCDGHDQNNDPFFTGQSDWYVIEGVKAHGAGSGDGHGIYLSNGSDWMIVRNNELWDNFSSDFQINADPQSTCTDDGVAFDAVECDAVAGTHPTGGRGASDFVLVENNFFHHGRAQGANFTSVRNALVRNNVFAVYARHGVSFWQETDNPRLGSRNNTVVHNLFVATVANRQAVQFVVHSSGNTFANNVLVAAAVGPQGLSTLSNGLLMEVDATTADSNTYTGNVYIGGRLDGRTAGAAETSLALNPAWFPDFPTATAHDADAFRPAATAPWLNQATRSAAAPTDRAGTARASSTEAGPWEMP